MTFKPAFWAPAAWVLALVNLGATWFAARAAEPWHAAVHAALAVAFALWAERLRRRLVRGNDASLANLRQQLDDMQAESRGQVEELAERLDFAERLLAQERVKQGVKPPGSQAP
jgi:hypothetical protein